MSFDDTAPSPREGDLNLTTHRTSQDDVWSRADREAKRQMQMPLAISVVSCLIAARAIGGHRWRGALLAGLGAAGAVWVAVNPDRANAWRRRILTRLSTWGTHNDIVVEASEESFPASDSPSWTPTVGTGLRRQPATH